LFHSCTKDELRELASITTETTVCAGHVLCKEGATGREFFVVVDGEAIVTIAGEQVATVAPGGFCGEMALLDGGPRVATVTAATDMTVLVVSQPEFFELVGEVPTVTRRILAGVAARLRTADAQLHPSRLGV
jgi:CRP/FNR family transcriptional regulator, cyclic AMP receptor protein